MADVFTDKIAMVYTAIRVVLDHFYTKALRDITQNRRINLDLESNYDIKCALAYMRDVSENPQKYFSRDATECDWKSRADEYRKSKKSPLLDAYGTKRIVDDPADIVYKNVAPCMMDEKMAHQYRDFCKWVMNWEYSRTENDYHVKQAAINQQDKIVDFSKLVSELIPSKKFNINTPYGGKCR
jgi:hypothetical protein